MDDFEIFDPPSPDYSDFIFLEELPTIEVDENNEPFISNIEMSYNDLNMIASNYNFFRILNGLGGLSYST